MNSLSSCFIPSVSSVFQVNVNKTCYRFDFCLDNNWSKLKPIKLRKQHMCNSDFALLCGNGIWDLLDPLSECTDSPSLRRVFRWGSAPGVSTALTSTILALGFVLILQWDEEGRRERSHVLHCSVGCTSVFSRKGLLGVKMFHAPSQ